MKIWLTSDTHYFHRNVIKYCNRPFVSVEEMNQALIDNWNSLVQPDDLVYHLGDFAFCGIERAKNILSQLNGTKICIRGNHDQSPERMKKMGFSAVYEKMELEIEGISLILSHFPYAPTEREKLIHRLKNFWKFWRKKKYMDLRYMDLRPKNEGKWLIHGHSHNPPERRLRKRMIDVGVDANHYHPIALEEIMAIIKNSNN